MVGSPQCFSTRDVLGELTQFVLYAVFMAGSFAALAEIWGELQRAMGASERLAELINDSENIETGEDKKISNVMESENSFKRIKFDSVTFSYPSNPNKKVLDNICFELQPGSMTALVGPSGAGKSTIFSLLLGFYQASDGKIMFDGDVIEEFL